MRVIGLDVSGSVAEIAYLENGLQRAGGRVGLRRDELERFAAKLKPDDHVVLEATGNTIAIANVLTSHVGRVIVANPLQVRLIAEARVKTDKIDAAILAQLYASGFLPEVWIPDETTQAMRRQVSRRAQIVRQRTRLRDDIHATSDRAVSRDRPVWQERAGLAEPAAATHGRTHRDRPAVA
ncbi:transposase [Cupriavidus necator]